jgi:uncharacterized protein CbrC (UPF0167 family)
LVFLAILDNRVSCTVAFTNLHQEAWIHHCCSNVHV